MAQRIEIFIPDDLFICHLEETSKGAWMVGLRVRRPSLGLLLAGIADSPQGAVDSVAEKIYARLATYAEQTSEREALSELTLDDLDL